MNFRIERRIRPGQKRRQSACLRFGGGALLSVIQCRRRRLPSLPENIVKELRCSSPHAREDSKLGPARVRGFILRPALRGIRCAGDLDRSQRARRFPRPPSRRVCPRFSEIVGDAFRRVRRTLDLCLILTLPSGCRERRSATSVCASPTRTSVPLIATAIVFSGMPIIVLSG